MLAYGTAAQEYFGENTDRLANALYYQIKVQKALLSEGCNHGLYAADTQLGFAAAETNTAGEVFLYWENSAGAMVSEELNYTITVSNKNEIYTAVYGVIETPITDPLIYTEQSDGTYSVKANPEVELPTAIAIPATYEGKAVTVIENNAFYGCSSLKTVYYGVTASDWATISIDSSNSYLTNANRYSYSETQPTTTGNFWHYVDGMPTKW